MLRVRRIVSASMRPAVSSLARTNVGALQFSRAFCAAAAQAQTQSNEPEAKPVIRFTRNWLKEPVPVQKDWHRANGFLEKAVGMLRPVIDEKKKEGVQIFYRKEDEGLFVHTDADRVTQILVCFLDNALKYTTVQENHGGGQVFPTKIWIGCERLIMMGNRVRFYVKDCGNGVSKEFRDGFMSFEPGSDVSADYPLKEGLQTAQTLAKDLGTAAYCFSHHELTASRRIKRHMQRPDFRGSTFVFEMDMDHEYRAPEPKEPSEPAPDVHPGFPQRFLIAEGWHLSREALRRGLVHVGAKSVVDVGSSNEILEKCKDEEFDLVMVGHRLDGETLGEEAVQQLRKQGYKGKVFAMQSQANEEWHGCDHIEKAPMCWERLEIALDMALNGKERREPSGLFGNKKQVEEKTGEEAK